MNLVAVQASLALGSALWGVVASGIGHARRAGGVGRDDAWSCSRCIAACACAWATKPT